MNNQNIFIIEDDCKNELVKSCAECSKIYIDGKLNIAGLIFREQQTKTIENANGKYQYLNYFKYDRKGIY